MASVRHVGGEVVAGLADPRKNLLVVLEKIGRPLVSLAPHEAVEIVETHPYRPLVERASDGVLVGRRVVILAKPRCGIAVVLEDSTDGGVVWTDDRVIARKAGRQLGDYAEANGMMIATGDQRRPRRRAQSGGIEFRVAQSRFGDPVQRRGGNDAPKVPLTPYPGHRHDSRTLGARLGGTMVGGHHGLESLALSLITPPNLGSGAGS